MPNLMRKKIPEFPTLGSLLKRKQLNLQVLKKFTGENSYHYLSMLNYPIKKKQAAISAFSLVNLWRTFISGRKSLFGLTLLLVVGCSSMSPNDESLVRSETSIKQAKQVGAIEHAAIELKMAEEKLAQAWQAYKKKEYKTSYQLAHEAEASANLAEITAKNKKMQIALNEVQQSIQLLKQKSGNR